MLLIFFSYEPASAEWKPEPRIPFTLDATVIDENGPLSRMPVVLRRARIQRGFRDMPIQVRESPSQTDHQGRFVLEASSDSTDILFSVLVPGSGSSPWQVLRPQPHSRARIEFRIAPSGFVEGTVRDTHGRAMPRAYVSFLHEIRDHGGRYVYETRTNHNGRYRLEGLPKDQFWVIAAARGAKHVVGPGRSDEVKIEHGRATRHDVLLCPDLAFSVIVVNSEGQTLKSQPLWVGSMGDTTDSRGRLRVKVRRHFMWGIRQVANPLPETWQLGIWSGDRERPDAIGFVTIDFTKRLPRKPLPCRIETTGGIEIAMTSISGKPSTYGNLSFFRPGDLLKSANEDWPWLTGGKEIHQHSLQEFVRSAPGQPFRILGIPHGQYELWIWDSSEGGVHATARGESILHIESGRILVLDPASFPGMHRIEGQISGVNPNAITAGGFDVYFVPLEGGIPERLRHEPPALPDPKGRFGIRFPKRGQFRVLLRARTSADHPRRWISEWVEVDSRSAQVSTVEFKLREAPYLQLKITYPDGTPARESQAVVHPIEVESEFPLPDMDCAVWEGSREGDCEVGCLPRGRYSIEIFPPGREDACQSRMVELDEPLTYVEEFVIEDGRESN